MVFRQGAKGTGKPFSECYRLQRFGRGGSSGRRSGPVPRSSWSPSSAPRRSTQVGESQDAGAGDRRPLRPAHPDLPVARAARARAAALAAGGSSSASRSTSPSTRPGAADDLAPPARRLRAGARDDPGEGHENLVKRGAPPPPPRRAGAAPPPPPPPRDPPCLRPSLRLPVPTHTPPPPSCPSDPVRPPCRNRLQRGRWGRTPGLEARRRHRRALPAPPDVLAERERRRADRDAPARGPVSSPYEFADRAWC